MFYAKIGKKREASSTGKADAVEKEVYSPSFRDRADGEAKTPIAD